MASLDMMCCAIHPAYSSMVGLRRNADAAHDCSSNGNHIKLVNAMHVICWLKVPPLRQPFKCERHESDYMCALYVANTRHALCIQSTTFMNTKRHRDICRQASPILER